MSLPAQTLAATAILLAMGASDAETARTIDLIGASPVPDTVPELIDQLRTGLEFTRTANALEQTPETHRDHPGEPLGDTPSTC